jgi:hypothetical protein
LAHIIGKGFKKYEPLAVRGIVKEGEETARLIKPDLAFEQLLKFRVSKTLHPEMAEDMAYSINLEDAGDDLRSLL